MDPVYCCLMYEVAKTEIKFNNNNNKKVTRKLTW